MSLELLGFDSSSFFDFDSPSYVSYDDSSSEDENTSSSCDEREKEQCTGWKIHYIHSKKGIEYRVFGFNDMALIADIGGSDKKKRTRLAARESLMEKRYGTFSILNEGEEFKSLKLPSRRDEKTGESVIYDRKLHRFILESPIPKVWTVELLRFQGNSNGRFNVESLNRVYNYHEGETERLANRIVVPRIYMGGFISRVGAVAYCIRCCGMVFPVDPNRIYVANKYNVYPNYREPEDKSVLTMHGRGLTYTAYLKDSLLTNYVEIFEVLYFKTVMVSNSKEKRVWHDKYNHY